MPGEGKPETQHRPPATFLKDSDMEKAREWFYGLHYQTQVDIVTWICVGCGVFGIVAASM